MYFFNKILKDKVLNYISCLLLILSVVCSLSSILFLGLDNQTTYFLGEWIVSGSLGIDWSINYSILTGSMVLMVNFVSSLIHIYSVGYMENDPKKKLFLWDILDSLLSLCFYLYLHQT